MTEAYLYGVTNRKIDDLVKAFLARGIRFRHPGPPLGGQSESFPSLITPLRHPPDQQRQVGKDSFSPWSGPSRGVTRTRSACTTVTSGSATAAGEATPDRGRMPRPHTSAWRRSLVR
jgi:hypothetical protein